MTRPVRSTVAVAALLSLAVTGCQTAPASTTEDAPADPAVEAPAAASNESGSAPSISVPSRSAPSGESAPAAEPEAPAAAAAPAEESERPNGVLLDYYRGDSRGNIRALESNLKPLSIPPAGSGSKSPIE
ncbi:MAG: hypothetical protein AAF957_07330 [Planctomycetota bacterium]